MAKEEADIEDQPEGSNSPETVDKFTQNVRQNTSNAESSSVLEHVNRTDNGTEQWDVKVDMWKRLNFLAEAANSIKSSGFMSQGSAAKSETTKASDNDGHVRKSKVKGQGQKCKAQNEKGNKDPIPSEPERPRKLRRVQKEPVSGNSTISTQAVLDAASTKRKGRTNPVRFSSVASEDEEGDEPLPQISASCLRNTGTRCSPKAVVDLVKRLSEKQKDDIKSIGFGGLLSIKIERFPFTPLLQFLIDNFDNASRVLMSKFVVTDADVQDVFLLPRGKVEVKEKSKREKRESIQFLARLFEGYKFSPNSEIKAVETIMLEKMQDGGDDFKRLFVIFALSTMLTPTANRKLNFNAAASLEDVEKIKDYNWSEYVLQKLCAAVDIYNKSDAKTTISSCILILQILYFHRYKWRGKSEPKVLPLISHWDYERIARRSKEEEKAKQFGFGDWDKSYPISARVVEETSLMPLRIEPVIRKKLQKVKQEKNEECKKRTVTYRLPDGEMTDEEIHAIAKNADHEIVLLFKRDVSVFMNLHLQKIKNMREKHHPRQGEDQTTETQFFRNPELYERYDKELKQLYKLKKIADDAPSFD